MRKGVKR